ncbi:MAG: hypothetical protein AAB669_01880 [Patescibacteria group bacterium]
MIETESYTPEGAKDFIAPETSGISIQPTEDEDGTVEQPVQPYSSKIAEYITGMKPEDPAMIDKLFTDQEIIRSKYHLPSLDLPPAEYERGLKQIAQKLKVTVKPTSDCGKFFEENSIAGAVYFDEANQIGMDMDRSNEDTYSSSLGDFEHELIHAIQKHDTPSMPIELMEYEAYLAGGNVEFLKTNPEAIKDIFFGFLIGSSVNIYYKTESEKRGEAIVPVWDRPIEPSDSSEGLPEQVQQDIS